MKRFAAILLAVLVGLPWAVFPAAKGDACPMPRAPTAESCSYCTHTAPFPTSGPTLNADCCRFLPKPEAVSEQAATLKPHHLPDLAASLAIIDGASTPTASPARVRLSREVSPPHALPTRTTHLRL